MLISTSRFFWLAGLILLLLTGCSTTYSSLDDLQKTTGTFSIDAIDSDTSFEKSYLVWVEQPIDHDNPAAGTFKQRVWLSHKSLSAPMVVITEGYSAPHNYVSELASMLGANQIIIEHRFFGESVPKGKPWKYLTVEQSARDHEAVIDLFNDLYKGKWITTGISKGGQMALIHRAFFPKSVDLTVTYVAPFNLEREDHRLPEFFESVGSEADRSKILTFQKEVLKRRDDMILMLGDMANTKGWTFKMGLNEAFELSVLEYPFSFWQWCVPVSEIPDTKVTSRELFDQLYRGIDFSYFSDQESANTGPFFYQAYHQLGYYGYDTHNLKPWLKVLTSDFVSSDILIPDEVNEVAFIPETSVSILKRFRQADPPTIHIVGGNDPWSSTSPDVSDLKHSLKVVCPGGCHLTRISTLPDSLRRKVVDFMQSELGFN
jgi:hypothetical protein